MLCVMCYVCECECECVCACERDGEVSIYVMWVREREV